MTPFSHRLARRAALALAMLIAITAVPLASADDWGRDRAALAAQQGLDPAIRTAIAARTGELPFAAAVDDHIAVVSDDGFAWGAAGLGALVGIAVSCALLACVNVVRHDGRLRSA